MKKWILGLFLPAGLLAAASALGVGLVLAGQAEPTRAAVAATPRSLSVLELEPGAVPYVLHAVGEVNASQDVSIASEVSGTVTWVDPELRAGMRVEAGQVIARLDPTSYEASVASARATLATAEQALALEEGQGTVAELESSLVGPIAAKNPALVRREPQLAAARADVASARAALADARRQQGLTRIAAPFDAIVAEETLDVGQLVTSSSTLGRWVGTSRAEVQVSVPVAALSWLEGDDIRATLHPQGAGATEARTADGVVSTGVVDATTRTARLLLWVDGPYATDDGPRLFPGSYVDVEVVGTPVADALAIPAEALVDGGAVWSVSAEDTLKKRTVEVLWQDGDKVVIRAPDGLDAILSRPSGSLLDGQPITRRAAAGEAS